MVFLLFPDRHLWWSIWVKTLVAQSWLAHLLSHPLPMPQSHRRPALTLLCPSLSGFKLTYCWGNRSIKFICYSLEVAWKGKNFLHKRTQLLLLNRKIYTNGIRQMIPNIKYHIWWGSTVSDPAPYLTSISPYHHQWKRKHPEKETNWPGNQSRSCWMAPQTQHFSMPLSPSFNML